MPVIEWSDSYALGNEIIDEHHQHLINLLNNTFEVFIDQRRKVEVDQVTMELIDYATYHFAAEEQLMSQHTYPLKDKHCCQHEHFIDQVKILQKEYAQGRHTLSLELIVFLKEWTLNHILTCDRDYMNAFKGKKPARSHGLVLDLS